MKKNILYKFMLIISEVLKYINIYKNYYAFGYYSKKINMQRSVEIDERFIKEF